MFTTERSPSHCEPRGAGNHTWPLPKHHFRQASFNVSTMIAAQEVSGAQDAYLFYRGLDKPVFQFQDHGWRQALEA